MSGANQHPAKFAIALRALLSDAVCTDVCGDELVCSVLPPALRDVTWYVVGTRVSRVPRSPRSDLGPAIFNISNLLRLNLSRVESL